MQEMNSGNNVRAFIFFDTMLMCNSRFHSVFSGSIQQQQLNLKRLIERSKAANDVVPNTLLDLAKFLEPYKLAFAELYKLLCIALTSATSERCFSALKFIKTHLRSTMCDVRFYPLNHHVQSH